jgi:2-dehydropantoate 2-reductase
MIKLLQHLRVCVVGAGAVGGYFGVKLARARANVAVIARGQTLQVLQNEGWTLNSGGESSLVQVKAVDHSDQLGEQDLVILAVKAHDLHNVVQMVEPLIGKDTIVIPTINGVPWWFVGPSSQTPSLGRLQSVDPKGLIDSKIPYANVIGAVVYPSFSCPKPGVTQHHSGSKIVLGEPITSPDSGISPKLQSIVDLFKFSGLDVEASTDIRTEVWKKLLGNACFNPVSLLTSSPTDLMIDDPMIYRLFTSMMNELLLLGEALGLKPNISVPDRIALTRKLGHIKTSMLQDAQRGRAVEIEAILGAACELAQNINISTPTLNTVYALARFKSKTEGLLNID